MDDDHDYDPDAYPKIAFTWSAIALALIVAYFALS